MFTVTRFIFENHLYLVFWFQDLKNEITRLNADKSEEKGLIYVLEDMEERQAQPEIDRAQNGYNWGKDDMVRG